MTTAVLPKMDNLHYRLIFDPERIFYSRNLVRYGKYSFVLRVKIVTIFEPKVVTISARHTMMRKFAKFVRLYFPYITIFFNQLLEFNYS